MDGDKYFMGQYTLSRFRKDMMVAAIYSFSDEYSIKNRSLGTKCNYFCQLQWNTSSWTKIGDIKTPVSLLKGQLVVKTRVTVLSIRLAFGRAK